ncbi:MAG: triose-phosphate isomerase [Spirochaetes bacterium GWF1_31_7]|nr:MAG: triose-phosphate isomerase [Spirochaetes bacterium GWE1_32_154]OHD49090.1 MAG: triose-phosphate isomerase [Spirochaetes bacterium GWF1_31_7]OHD50324.1 MAG: triose-phosphate isomerase [Spirochaetes bacterium GWE2_31_10]OHD77345.1 MAG: triose-phosphate isomerase [Spirochaetes bacterium RIFOXYB1_FULL_32_8]HBD93889.1 triose-phosphate isomerase [Spirochaetia bacterium]
MRKYLMAGNWKMNLVPSEAKKFAEDLVKSIKDLDKDVEVMICPSFVCLPAVKEAIKGSIIKLGAQNMNENEKGAFTGEISADMLLDIGVEYVLLGHSERRHIYKETDQLINKKVKYALAKGLKPVLCIGELLEEREAGKTDEVNRRQLVEGLKDVSANDMANVVIAYEPVWAIGTGKVATPEIAEETQANCRKVLSDLYGQTIANNVTIQYGGSVTDTSVDGLMSQKNIDGALVGGASLKLDAFTRIAKFNKV